MIKIFNVSQIKAVDEYAIKNEPIKSIDLMERAANKCFDWLKNKFDKSMQFKIFCGLGNNGGDGLAIARQLINDKFKVEVYIVRYSNKCSVDFTINEKQLLKIKTVKVNYLLEKSKLPEISSSDIVIDALWGSGLSSEIEGFSVKIINHINESDAKIISIDVPSGLFCDDHNDTGVKIKATYTLSFQFPKLSFMFAENQNYVGHFQILPIGLDENFIAKQTVSNYYVTNKFVKNILKPRKKFEHKGNFGHGMIISGSYGKIGAAVLSSKACLRSGVGLLTVHTPKCGCKILQSSVPEAMVSVDYDHKQIVSIVPQINNYDAIGIGPGIGLFQQTQESFYQVISECKKPLVIDADGINILGENKSWIKKLPRNTILTPHLKEFERIAGMSKNDYERLELLRNFAIENNLCVVLKGAHSVTALPNGECYFNSTGNPGMATAGSGDALTGIITGLLAQGYSSKVACITGVFLHGLAGDIAACKLSQNALNASDIIDNIGNAFLEILEPEKNGYINPNTTF